MIVNTNRRRKRIFDAIHIRRAILFHNQPRFTTEEWKCILLNYMRQQIMGKILAAIL